MLVLAGTVFFVLLAGLPGRIAIARKHPDAEAVKIMGWAGLLFAVPWIQAFIWAFKPTDAVDIRRFPPAERAAIDEMIARLRGHGESEAAKGGAAAHPAEAAKPPPGEGTPG